MHELCGATKLSPIASDEIDFQRTIARMEKLLVVVKLKSTNQPKLVIIELATTILASNTPHFDWTARK